MAAQVLDAVPEARRALLAWFDADRRPLPWRDRTDPYAVWVSEIMLQQTRVETVLPYYERWLKRFPDIATLAAAPERMVLAAWSGLGYYSRARNLHRAAKELVRAHGGRLPADPDALEALPGIGPYTAGAVASIAFGVAAPAVDGNAVRVLARLTGERGNVAQRAVQKRLEATAARLVPPIRPGDWNQAVMELGARICTPRSPRCGECPVRGGCVAHAEGIVDRVPARPAKPAPRHEEVHFALVAKGGRILFVRRPLGGLLGGTLGLPGGSTDVPLARLVAEQSGLRVTKGRLLGAAEHVFTHRRWSMQVYACAPRNGNKTDGEVGGTGSRRWLAPSALSREPVSSALRKALAAAGV